MRERGGGGEALLARGFAISITPEYSRSVAACQPKSTDFEWPRDAEQAAVWKRLVDGELTTPDTWEVALPSGGDKRTHRERLLAERKLGALALLRNLRNMKDAGVDEALIVGGLDAMKVDRVLPFRFLVAVRYAPQRRSLRSVRWNSMKTNPDLLEALRLHGIRFAQAFGVACCREKGSKIAQFSSVCPYRER